MDCPEIIPPGQGSAGFPPHQHGVKEYLFVAQGRMQIELNDEVYQLGPGESMYFEADVQHGFRNVGEEECRYYLVIDSHEATP
ncbi:MAG: cupin domain-containing protein [Deltaproteobacteria bacterium]|nr:cupin domain-containing protein [Deltaproteobacteria bacterium]